MMRYRPALVVVVLLALVPAWAFGQATPLPLPTAPSGARPPIYTQPTPSAPPVLTTPPPTLAPPTPTLPATPPAKDEGAEKKAEGAEKGSETKDAKEQDKVKVPQVTSFPELTRGVGNAETLLQE